MASWRLEKIFARWRFRILIVPAHGGAYGAEQRVGCAAHKVIGAAIEVHRILGPGYLESVYEEALSLELSMRGVDCDRQTPVNIEYKGKAVGEGRLDLLVAERLIIELKTVDHLLPIHHAQVLSYLKATRKQIGLLINFNVRVLRDGVKRIVLSR